MSKSGCFSERLFLSLNPILKKYFPGIIHTKTSKTDRKNYKKICRLAAENGSVFKTFKRHKDYREVLEHVTENQGRDYLKIIKENCENLLKFFPKFKENDFYGSPIKYDYDVCQFSPTTLRYIKVLCDLKKIFGDLSGLKIVEIGGGYGGQCKIISDVFQYQSYSIVDLEDVVLLIQKYLRKLKVGRFDCLAQDQIKNNLTCDLVISNYAFSECIKAIQDDYINKVLNKAKRGYLTYNYDNEKPTLSLPMTPYNKKEIVRILSQKHVIRTIDEKPKTGPMNFIIIWDDTKKMMGINLRI